MVKTMKKFLVGLFLLASLSVLGANLNTERKLSTDREDKFLMLDEVSHVPDYEKFMSTYAKEKDDFRKNLRAMQEKNDNKGLIALMKKYIEKYPDDAYAYEVMGSLYVLENNTKEADKYFSKAIELGDDDTGKYSFVLLYANEKKGAKRKQADKYFEELSQGSYSERGLRELRISKTEALTGNAYAILRLAAFYSNYGNHKMAEKYATEFLEFDKEDIQNLNILSEAYIAQKKYAESEKLFLPLAQKGMMQAQYLLALGYYHAGNLKEAEKWAKKTLEKPERKQPDDIEAAKELLNRINSKLKELNKK